jgi:hypothetical protein
MILIDDDDRLSRSDEFTNPSVDMENLVSNPPKSDWTQADLSNRSTRGVLSTVAQAGMEETLTFQIGCFCYT